MNPKNTLSNLKIRCHSLGQLYIYVNLEFFLKILNFASRILDKMKKGHRELVKKAPQKIKKEI